MIDIRQDVHLNKKSWADRSCDLGVFYDAHSNRGELLDKGKGESLLWPFLAFLYQQMTGCHADFYGFEEYGTIESIDLNSTPVEVFFTSDSDNFNQSYPNHVFISNIPGTNIGGPYICERGSDYRSTYLWEWQPPLYGRYGELIESAGGGRTAYMKQTPIVGSGTAPADLSPYKGRWNYIVNSNSDVSVYGTLRYANLYFGYDDTPNTIGTYSLYRQTDDLGLSGTTRNAPVIGVDTSELTFTRDVTNATGASVTLKEAGMRGRWYGDDSNRDDMRIFWSRDVIGVTIPNGETASVNYRLKIENTANGGLLWQFMEILSRVLRSTDRESRNIFNNNQTESLRDEMFMAIAGGMPAGGGRFEQRDQYLLGPQIGQGTGNVVNTNVALDDAHGPDANGDLQIYGASAGPLTWDKTNGEAYFDISRVFYNGGSSALPINEVGLYVGGDGYNNIVRREHIHCIARHLISPGQSLPAGEAARLTYRFKIVV